jgi:Rho termination factor, N-terminal domain
MPSAWSNKDERQYEKIRTSAQKRGISAKRAKEIAARTVNKNRRRSGRTPNSSSQGTGNPNLSLADRTVEELRNKASELEIAGRSKMNKAALVRAIRRRQ